jgi:hypothetical protein
MHWHAGSVTPPPPLVGAEHRNDRRALPVVPCRSHSRIFRIGVHCRRRSRHSHRPGGFFRHFPSTPSWHHGIMASLAKHGQSRKDVTKSVRPGVTAIMKGVAGSKVGWGNERGGWRERWTWANLTNSSLGWQGTAASPPSMPSEWLGPRSPISQSHSLLPSHPFLGRSSTPSGNVTLLCIGVCGARGVVLGGNI